MTTRWTGAHLPAAIRWVRTEADARRYYDENADQIWVSIDGGRAPLSSLDPEVPEKKR